MIKASQVDRPSKMLFNRLPQLSPDQPRMPLFVAFLHVASDRSINAIGTCLP